MRAARSGSGLGLAGLRWALGGLALGYLGWCMRWHFAKGPRGLPYPDETETNRQPCNPSYSLFLVN